MLFQILLSYVYDMIIPINKFKTNKTILHFVSSLSSSIFRCYLLLLLKMLMMTYRLLFHGHFLCTRWAKWAERPPKVTKRSERWNNLQICPRRDSNSGGSDLWSNAPTVRPRRRPFNWQTRYFIEAYRLTDRIRMIKLIRLSPHRYLNSN